MRRPPFKFVFGKLFAESQGPVAHYGLLIRDINPAKRAHRVTLRTNRPDLRMYDIFSNKTWIPGSGWAEGYSK